jgi:hypothetical protein
MWIGKAEKALKKFRKSLVGREICCGWPTGRATDYEGLPEVVCFVLSIRPDPGAPDIALQVARKDDPSQTIGVLGWETIIVEERGC